ncbi:MAG: CoA-disulfide reductase [Treponema sp.]
MSKYIVVGGVAGGAGVAARLRRLDETADITVYERGSHISFANCGLPYYAGGIIADREALFVMTPEKFKAVLQVTAKVHHEVTAVNPQKRTVTVKNISTNEEFTESYDTLILSPGASPVRPPIPGIDSAAIYTLRSVSDIDTIKQKLDNPATKRVAVIGGGFIGLEMAENLHHRGIKVSIIEALDQVMNVIDYDMAALVQANIRSKGVHLHLKDGVKAFEQRGAELAVCLQSGQEIMCDAVILSIGVRPDTQLAKACNLAVAPNGAITVNAYFQTSDEHIYAIGDAIAFQSPFLDTAVTIPLAGPANKQARICADNIVYGHKKPYHGIIGTSIAKVFDYTAAATGLGEKALKNAGLPYKQAVTHAMHHAGYYPGASMLSIKILYNPENGRLWGAQAVGIEGVDKRIDVLAAYIKKNGTISDLAEFEHAYAPPFASAKDPINMLGFIAENDRDGLSHIVSWREVDSYVKKNAFILDVRTPEEYELGSLPNAVNIPNTALRGRLNEVPKDRPILVTCGLGLRGYLADRILRQNGYTDTVNFSGGCTTYKAVRSEQLWLTDPKQAAKQYGIPDGDETGGGMSAQAPCCAERSHSEQVALQINACGLQCPGPIIQLKKAMETMPAGGILTIQASDPGFARDAKSWCSLTGNQLLHIENTKGIITAKIEKGGGITTSAAAEKSADSATFIVFSNDMDKALAAFVLANGALATGKKVTMFFTFWGLSVLRKQQAPFVKKDAMGKMFGSMLPKGMGKLSLSSMNFGGMGAKMMKDRMKAKNVDQLETMFQQAVQAGVRLVACQMSMDIMGISTEELMDGVEIGGVATYMEAASKSGINLFV